MARTVDRATIESELETLEAQISQLKAIEPLEGVRIKWIKPGGKAGRPSQEKKYPRLIYAMGGTRNIKPHEVGTLQQQIEAARELRQLIKQRDRLLSRLAA